MVREDIVAGLKNALDRGASLERAKQSLLNAGYPAEEVEQAADQFSSDSVLGMQQNIRPSAASVIPTKGTSQQMSQPATQRMVQGPGFFARNWAIILLLIVLFVLLVIFGLVLMFKDTIASWFY